MSRACITKGVAPVAEVDDGWCVAYRHCDPGREGIPQAVGIQGGDFESEYVDGSPDRDDEFARFIGLAQKILLSRC